MPEKEGRNVTDWTLTRNYLKPSVSIYVSIQTNRLYTDYKKGEHVLVFWGVTLCLSITLSIVVYLILYLPLNLTKVSTSESVASPD